MKNILTFVKENINSSFSQLPFSVIDSLILSQIAYLPFFKYTSLKKFSGERIINSVRKDSKIPLNAKNLFIGAFSGIRYQHLQIIEPIDLKENNNEKQFAANCFVLSENIIYIAFRGTDATLLGWKEDFNMAFLDVVPSQKEALAYVNRIMEKYPQAKFYVGGHSKGGNLAVFAAAFCNFPERIIQIYSHDGPGFRQNIFSNEKYIQVANKIHKTIPQSSLFGLLMETQEKFYIVKSNQFWIFQHDPFSWMIENNDFIYLKETTTISKLFDASLNEWLDAIDDQQRELFIDTIYDVFVQLEIENFQNIHLTTIMKKLPFVIQTIPPDIRKFVFKTITTFLKIMKKTTKLYVEENHLL